MRIAWPSRSHVFGGQQGAVRSCHRLPTDDVGSNQVGPTGAEHADFVAITSKLKAKIVELQVLAMNLDTTTPTGKLMLNLMGSFTEFEQEIMLERQREGVAKARAEGKHKGRVPTAQRKAAEVVQL
jgi:DNA invertase Pin-like site-specific DNA recombinase